MKRRPQRRCAGPTGGELATRRKAKGWTQRQLAEAAGVGRTAVQYWERLPGIDPRGWAVKAMAEALGWVMLDYRRNNARARGWGDSETAQNAETTKNHEGRSAARKRVACGAKTRKGSLCRNMSEPGKRRCKFHGGMSTGARTPEGIERIREAQRRRWAHARRESDRGSKAVAQVLENVGAECGSNLSKPDKLGGARL